MQIIRIIKWSVSYFWKKKEYNSKYNKSKHYTVIVNNQLLIYTPMIDRYK